MSKPQVVGVILLEGADRQWEIAITQDVNGAFVPCGIRDTITHRHPDVLPSMEQVQQTILLGAWWEENKEVFTEGKVSHKPLVDWGDSFRNHLSQDEDHLAN